jgi:hypothetical protein
VPPSDFESDDDDFFSDSDHSSIHSSSSSSSDDPPYFDAHYLAPAQAIDLFEFDDDVDDLPPLPVFPPLRHAKVRAAGLPTSQPATGGSHQGLLDLSGLVTLDLVGANMPNYHLGDCYPFRRADLADVRIELTPSVSCPLDVAPAAFLRNPDGLLPPRGTTVGPNTITAMLRYALDSIDQRPSINDIVKHHMQLAALNPDVYQLVTPDAVFLLRCVIDWADHRLPSIVVSGLPGAGKTSAYIALTTAYASCLIVTISNLLLDDLTLRTAGLANVTCDTPHRALLSGTAYDLVIIDEAFALDLPIVTALASLGRRSVACGDPSQITAIGYVSSPLPFNVRCGLVHLNAPFSLTLPTDVATIGLIMSRVPPTAVLFSDVDDSLHAVDRNAPYTYACIARQCADAERQTIHTLQGHRCRQLVAHCCHLEGVFAGPASRNGHLYTLLSRASVITELDFAPLVLAHFIRSLEEMAANE